ncbi:hypothetical protein K474DRAFT_1660250 [Panus rudis PR-1116 ss-1]|nr:hypothetical protein K474DRAFT_1660250 [Panus rudis PR-1116 ss-1]
MLILVACRIFQPRPLRQRSELTCLERSALFPPVPLGEALRLSVLKLASYYCKPSGLLRGSILLLRSRSSTETLVASDVCFARESMSYFHFFAQSIYLSRYSVAVSLAILYYDWILTLPDEISLYWQRRCSFTSFLYFLNRYSSLIAHIPVAVQIYSPRLSIQTYVRQVSHIQP